MKIGIFAYNFEHKKTQEGLINLFLNGYKPSCILAADKVKLDFPQSEIRVSPEGLTYTHPKDIAKKLGIPYHVVIHNSGQAIKLVKKYRLDLGIILGTRILNEDVIKSFKIGVLNLHPGLLPDVAGLDTIKWAILMNYPQGATAHIIDKDIDKGKLVLQKQIPILKDDTLMDLLLRVQNTEQELMINSLKLIKHSTKFPEIIRTNYFKAVPKEVEKNLEVLFKLYKERWCKE